MVSADRILTGRVASVDATANALVLFTKQGKTTLKLAPDAKIKVGKESNLGELQTGSKVKVSYKYGGWSEDPLPHLGSGSFAGLEEIAELPFFVSCKVPQSDLKAVYRHTTPTRLRRNLFILRFGRHT